MTNWRTTLAEDYNHFSNGLPKPLEEYVLNTYGISLASEYGGLPIKNPFGKASGQLSLNAHQVERDAEAGLGFFVLKTLIAQNATGEQSMKAWAIPAAKMTIEEIIGTREDVRGEHGWTVTWKGRGWAETFKSYLDFFRAALDVAMPHDMLVVPSVKYHLPKPGESEWKTSEYEFTTSQLHHVWRALRSTHIPLEKDFSPTLAGDQSFSSVRDTILKWLTTVPRLIHETSVGEDVRLGMKLFNASHADEFQSEMLQACEDAIGTSKADYLIYGNRLFDPTRSYEGVLGAAYGGPDLSDRNLSILSKWNRSLPLSATGNILTGKTAFEYLKRGATSFQMHTLFQLPDSIFDMKGGTRTERALHRLLFHPDHGFLASLLLTKDEYGWADGFAISDFLPLFANRS